MIPTIPKISTEQLQAELRGETWPDRQIDYFRRNPIKRRVWNLVRGARARARAEGVTTDLTAAWLEPIIRAGVCQVTGIAFDMEGIRGPFVPSIDRIKAGGDYQQENCRVVVLIHNLARGPWGDGPAAAYAQAYSRVLSKQTGCPPFQSELAGVLVTPAFS